jgi:membrane protease YdiL (CAAX protease family)
MSESGTSIPPQGGEHSPQEPAPAGTGQASAPGSLTFVATDVAASASTRIEEEFRDVQRVCVFYGAMLLPVLVGSAWSYHGGDNSIDAEYWFGGCLYGIVAAYALVWRREWIDLLRWPTTWPRRFVGLLVATPVCSITAAHWLSSWGRAIGLPVADLLEGYGEGEKPVYLLFIWAVLLAPVFEEIAFRGLMLRKLQRLMKPLHAIWVSAFLFGLIHFSVLSMAVFLVPLAVVAGYATRKSGSLVPAFCLHAAHNAGVIVLELLAG